LAANCSVAVLDGAHGDNSVAGSRHQCKGAPVPNVHFSERIADRYDATSADMFHPAVVGPAIDFLADLPTGGAALELGIGTGRIALPLSERGVPVHGIDVSPAMVERLRAKPGSDAIGVTIGDFPTTRVGGPFTLAYLVYNTIMNLTSQDEQVACFNNVAEHLEPGGRFAVEVIVPPLRRLPPGETARVFALSATHLGFDEFTDLTAAQLGSVPPQLARRRGHGRGVLCAIPLRVAVRARSHGSRRRNDAPRTLERMDTRAVHERKPVPRVGVGNDGVALRADRQDAGAPRPAFRGASAGPIAERSGTSARCSLRATRSPIQSPLRVGGRRACG
jgi:SAM-dependent methyltransferase